MLFAISFFSYKGCDVYHKRSLRYKRIHSAVEQVVARTAVERVVAGRHFRSAGADRVRQSAERRTTIDAVEPFLQKLAAPSIAEIEELISELQAARNCLQSERDRLEREMDRYVHLNDAASASVKVISDGLGQWRKASNAMRGARPDR
jgi:hypothetical protein